MYAPRTRHDEVHFAETADGVLLALYRYRPVGGGCAGPPVILCHGFTSNHCTWDLMGKGLAKYLAGRGRDVWCLDLRGSGRSTLTTSGRRVSFNYDFDDLVRLDVPAAIDFVLSATRSEKADWVGHSMGGMLLYAYLVVGDGEKIRRGCAAGSPGTMKDTPRFFHSVTKLVPPYRYWPVIHSSFFLTFVLLPVRLGLGVSFLAVNSMNVGVKMLTAMAANLTGNFSTKLGLHLAYMVRKGDFREFPPGELSYEKNLEKITTPLLLVAGGGDRLAPPWRMKFVYDAISSTNRKFVKFSKENGNLADYGHTDLLLSTNAQQEVIPTIADWLEEEIPGKQTKT